MKILIAMPARNEAKVLAANVKKVVLFCRQFLAADEVRIVIAENCSGDQTVAIAQSLAQQYPEVALISQNLPGKGRAIRTAWQSEPAGIYAFMDADLATDLSALPPLIAAIKEGNNLALGSRRLKLSKARRSWARRLFSWGYYLAAKIILGTKITDLACGFKVIDAKVKDVLLPQILDNSWFFDSELVLLAEQQGFKIKQLPVIWSEVGAGSRPSQVKTWKLARDYLRQLWRLRKSRP